MTELPDQPKHTNIRGEFVRFSLVGAAGFIIDTGVLYFGLWALALGPYSARVLSYLIAATATWLLHRSYTFKRSTRRKSGPQWALFIVLNGLGGGLNYAVYAALIATLEPRPETPLIGVFAGSAIALAFNFFVNRSVVFR